jgi:Fe-S oxidoreductase
VPIGLEAPDFWDPLLLDKELRRVFDICQGCRLCFKLCPSFERLFAYIDAQDGDVEGLQPAQINTVIDLCYQCKRCYPICPYIPPHHWEVDFPRLMLRAKALQTKEHGRPYRQRIISNPEFLGKWGSRTAPISNWMNSFGLNRQAMHALMGIHQERVLPQFHRETFVYLFC